MYITYGLAASFSYCSRVTFFYAVYRVATALIKLIIKEQLFF